MKKISIMLLVAFLYLTGCATQIQSKNVELETEFMREKIEIVDETSEAKTLLDLPEPDLLEGWLGSYEQNGTLWDELRGNFQFYIFREQGKYYGYLCVGGNESGTSCYFDERILTEIRGGQDMIQVYFLEKQTTIQGCHHEEYPDIFVKECGESKLDEAIREYELQDVLFTLKREEDHFSVTEEKMLLGKNDKGAVRGFTKLSHLSMDLICDKDNEIFLKMVREKEEISNKEQPSYRSYDNDGELALDLYLNPEQESGLGIYYGETQISKYITLFDIVSWEHGVWKDNKYSLLRGGSEIAATLDEYQEYKEYNDQGQITSFRSEGIVTGWGAPQKENLVEIEFFYRDDGTLEKKRCHFNHREYGTTRQSETFYFDTDERLRYATAYITSGGLTDHYFYDEGKEEPAYYLTLDHSGNRCYGEMVEYDAAFTNYE